MTRNRRVAITVLVLLAFAALITGVFVSQQIHQSKTRALANFHGTRLANPRSMQPFSLEATNGQAFNNDSLHGKWTLVFFGFTNCGYLCPTTLTELAKTYRILQQKNVSPLPQIVFISVDPTRDDRLKIKKYVRAFDPSFLGARGSEKQVHQLAASLGVAYERVAPAKDSSQNYDIQHNGAVILFNPRGELEAFFTSPQQAALLAADYTLLVS